MTTCAIKWCGKSSRTSNYQKDGITFHRFPKCPEMKKIWTNATCREEGWCPTKNSVVCSRHFTEDNFHILLNRRRLMDSALPILYLPVLIPNLSTMGSSADTLVMKTESLVDDKLSNKLISGSPLQDTKSDILDTTKINSGALTPIAGPSSAYVDTTVKKRLCRRIVELTNIVKSKNKELRKLRDSNRRLKRQIVSLKSSFLGGIRIKESCKGQTIISTEVVKR